MTSDHERGAVEFEMPDDAVEDYEASVDRPAVAAPSAVEEVREWNLDRHATVSMLLHIADRHARELDELRKRIAESQRVKRRLEALEKTLNDFDSVTSLNTVQAGVILAIRKRAAQIEEAK